MAKNNELKLNFVDAIIHELKTSLTAIIVSAELLSDELQPEDKSVLGRLIQSVIRNARSIDERLSLLSETGELLTENARFQPESVNLSNIVQNVATQLYPEIQRRKQTLTLEVPDSLPLTRADPQYLEQILLTLIANASKFTKEEGKITVSAYQDGSRLVVQISDTGVGIPANEQEQVFMPYYQVKHLDDDSRKSSSGLGLAIAKFLVGLHGGKIWLESTVGQGSKFYFSLPMVVSVESSSNR